MTRAEANPTEHYSDLKLIDELLCDLRWSKMMGWKEVEEHSSVTRYAMARLRSAYRRGEMASITLGLARYFDGTEP